MSKSMLVNVVNNEESRIAIVADGRLEELSIETAQQEQIEGNIYKARIVKVIASLDAVFVDYGRERNGFLAAPDIHPQYFRGDKRDVDALHKGQDLLVQVKKGEIGNKGAALTTYVSLPGRHFVLMPHVSKRGVSRRIEDEATRKQLRKILDGSGIPEEMGYIARTAAEGRTKQELTRDASYLLRLWKTIQARYEKARAPALLYEETDIVIRTLRDYFTPSIEEVLIDDEGIYRQVEAFFEAVMPTHKKRLKLYQAQAPLFSKHNLEDQIASIYAEKVALPSGGSLVIEQTEALVSIDVNSGKTTSGKDIEETALIANKEAAEEAARQLRLRDMGGLIVIDFIDMRPAKNRSEVRKVLQKALKEDKARTDTGTISKFGLLELSRQRLKGIARAGAIQPCPMCSGLGSIRTPESSALSVLRRVQLRLPRKGAVRQVLVGVPGPVATLLQNRHRTKLLDLESDFDTEIFVFAEEALAANQFYLEYRIKDRSEVETDLPEGFNRARLLAPQGLPDLPQRTRRPALLPLLEEEPDTIEVPAEPDTDPDAEEQPEVAAGAGDGAEEASREPGKKRRRRRRRGRGDGNRPEAGDNSTAADGDGTGTPRKDPGLAAAEAAAAEADAEAAELAASSESRPVSASAKRRQRRRRSTARTREEGGPEGSVPQATAGEVEKSTAEPPAAEEATPDTDGSQTAEAPKRTRRPRRRKPSAENTGSGELAAAPQTPVADSPNSAAHGGASAASTGRAEAAAAHGGASAASTEGAGVAAAHGGASAASTGGAGAAAAQGGASAASTGRAGAAAASGGEPVAGAPAAEELPPAEKPKRARRPRRKPSTESTASGELAAVPQAPAADIPDDAGHGGASAASTGRAGTAAIPEETPPTAASTAKEPPLPEKPKRARRPRKPKVAEVPASDTTESTPATQPAAASTGGGTTPPAVAPEKTPAKPRRTRKKAVAEEPGTVGQEAPEEEPKPARAPRKPRSRAKPTVEKAEATASSGAEEPVTGKEPAKRAPRSRKASPKTPDEPEAPTAKKPPRRRKTATPASGGEPPAGTDTPAE